MANLVCSRCGKNEKHRVIYGYPSPELLEQAGRGEIVLGGCQLGRPMESWLCADCNGRLFEELSTQQERNRWAALNETLSRFELDSGETCYAMHENLCIGTYTPHGFNDPSATG